MPLESGYMVGPSAHGEMLLNMAMFTQVGFGRHATVVVVLKGISVVAIVVTANEIA